MSSKNPIESDGVSYPVTTGLEYDVFLSFRGPDTRTSFTDHLYVRLADAGVRVFRDDEELRKGEKIEPDLLKGINKSKIAIPIFSKGYAASTWCLKELAQIVECKKSTGLKVMPIFYNVTPSEVRNQTGEYEKAFESHEKCYDKNTIMGWKKALREVGELKGELKGWDLQSGTHRRQEGELVKEVTNVLLAELKKAHLLVTDQLVGLECHVEEILNTLTNETRGVKVVSIHGMGGIGKTTLGKVIYNNLLPDFENHCFLADIRETTRSKGMVFLQKRLISKILNEISVDFSHIDEGIEIINERFYNKRVLLFLDDIDENLQLKALIGKRDQLGSGSRIIITTRNIGIFNQLEVDRFYELSGLDSHHALRLFSKHAFRNDKPPKENAVLSQRIVEIAGGLPLALEVLGSLLYGKDSQRWVSIVKQLEKVPHKDVIAKLRISYDALEYQEKHMFLDIACFFIGEDERIAIHFWDESEGDAIEVLQQMSLVKIQEDHSIWMHDQLRDMGREIVRQENNEPEKRSRLWNEEEGTKLFTQKLGSDNVRGINLNFQWRTEYFISNKDFARLPNLRLLRVHGFDYKSYKKIMPDSFCENSPLIFSKLRWLSWHCFPRTFDTSNVSMEDLVVLDLSFSNVKSDWNGWSHIKMAKNLRILNLTECRKLVKTSDLSCHLKLEQLILQRCILLQEIDESISMLEHLTILNLFYCRRLGKLPQELSCAESLEELIIDKTPIQEIPSWPPMRRLRVFGCSHCYNLINVSSLDFSANLRELSFERTRITILPNSIGNLPNLLKLSLVGTEITELPDTINKLKNLKELYVNHIPIKNCLLQLEC